MLPVSAQNRSFSLLLRLHIALVGVLLFKVGLTPLRETGNAGCMDAGRAVSLLGCLSGKHHRPMGYHENSNI